jgi:hypothetical protein
MNVKLEDLLILEIMLGQLDNLKVFKQFIDSVLDMGMWCSLSMHCFVFAAQILE